MQLPDLKKIFLLSFPALGAPVFRSTPRTLGDETKARAKGLIPPSRSLWNPR